MNIVIVGLGVIGGSFAMALQKTGGHQVFGVDTDPKTLEKALARGLIEKGCTTGEAFYAKADLVIVALYPTQVAGFVQQHAALFKKGCVITDVAGIKRPLVAQIARVLPKGVDFVFGHPMAGREKKGLDFASETVFQGANYLLMPTETNTPDHLEMVESLVLSLGFKRVRRLTPEFHDAMIAFTSQLPHALAVALINSDEEGRDTGNFIGDSYRELTRIANINEALWSELFLGNRDCLLLAIENFERELDTVKNALMAQDEEALVRCFVKSSARRQALNL